MAGIQIKQVEPMTVMSLSFTGPYSQAGERMEDLMSWLLRAGHPYSAAPMALYYDDPAKVAEDALRGEVCLAIEERCAPADEVECKDLAGCTVAATTFEGAPEQISGVYQQIFGWAAENGYRYVEGEPTRELFLMFWEDDRDPDQFCVEVQVPVEKV